MSAFPNFEDISLGITAFTNLKHAGNTRHFRNQGFFAKYYVNILKLHVASIACNMIH